MGSTTLRINHLLLAGSILVLRVRLAHPPLNKINITMIINRFKREKGVYSFRTPPSDYLNLAPLYRNLVERGRTDLVERTIRSDVTMVTAMESSFDEESYMEWAPKIYKHRTVARWNPDFWMMRESDFYARRKQDVEDMVRMYENICNEKSVKYIPVRWTNGCLSEDDVKLFPRHLLDRAERASVPLYYFALRRVTDMSSYRTRLVLYVKQDFLETFKTGQDLINYYRMASERNFKQVYGFS